MGCSKAFLFFFNIVYFGISAAVLFVAGWLIKKFGDISNITADTYTLVPCGILIGVGILVFITALFGCCGTCRDSKCCLSFFVILLFFLFAMEVTAGVMGYVYRHKTENFVNKGFTDAIRRYSPDEDTSLDKAVDDLQKNLKCCGSKGPSDWHKYSEQFPYPLYPKSCCSKPIGGKCVDIVDVYNEGCLEKISEEVKHNLAYVLGTAIAIAMWQLLGIIGACYIMCCSRESGYLRIDGGIRV
ncbi:tetraspanin-3-like [Montipora capricornis]|uniref:tetraspanin-3-like n=1 Tax=Montipora capricornis TaxID=246305 RepID=UPI0035F20DE6